MGSEFGFDSPNPACREESIGWAHDFHWKGEDTRVFLCATHCIRWWMIQRGSQNG